MLPNPSLKLSPNGGPPGPGPAVPCTLSPARAWRPTVGANLARTLGTTSGAFLGHQSSVKSKTPGQNFRCGSLRQVLAGSSASRFIRRARSSALTSYLASLSSAERVARLPSGPEVFEKVSSSCRRRSGRGSSFVSLRRGLTCSHRWQFSSPASLERVQRALWRLKPAVASFAVQVVPNPSFKPSPNGVPRGPGWRYAVHFRHPGPRVTPLVPA